MFIIYVYPYYDNFEQVYEYIYIYINISRGGPTNPTTTIFIRTRKIVFIIPFKILHETNYCSRLDYYKRVFSYIF